MLNLLTLLMLIGYWWNQQRRFLLSRKPILTRFQLYLKTAALRRARSSISILTMFLQIAQLSLRHWKAAAISLCLIQKGTNGLLIMKWAIYTLALQSRNPQFMRQYSGFWRSPLLLIAEENSVLS